MIKRRMKKEDSEYNRLEKFKECLIQGGKSGMRKK